MKNDNNKKHNALRRILTAALALILGASGVEGIKKNLYLPNTNGNTPIEQNEKQGEEVGDKTAKTSDKTTREKTGEKSSKIKEGEKDSSGKASVPSKNKKTTGGNPGNNNVAKSEEKQPNINQEGQEKKATNPGTKETDGEQAQENYTTNQVEEENIIRLPSYKDFLKLDPTANDKLTQILPGYFLGHRRDEIRNKNGGN